MSLLRATGTAAVSFLLAAGPPARAGEAWLIREVPAEGANPLALSRREDGVWLEEDFPADLRFSGAFSPVLGIDPAGTLWAVWAGRVPGRDPAIYFSRRTGGRWTEPRPAAPDSSRWQQDPAIAFDDRGNPLVVWSGLEGSSTEIFAAFWRGDGFSRPEMISSPDDSPDSLPAVGFDRRGNPYVIWEGWESGRARIYRSRRIAGLWSPEEPVSPSGRDQTEPALERGRATWREGGIRLAEEPGKVPRPEPEKIPAGLPLSPPLPPDGKAWLLFLAPGGEWEYRRLETRGFPAAAPKSPAGRAPAGFTDYYIGYGDSITYGHISPDAGLYDREGRYWYGKVLSGLLPSLQPLRSFYFFNQGYPGAKTKDLLLGPGHADWPCPGIEAVIDQHPEASKILIMGGTNDIGRSRTPTTPEETKFYLGLMIDRARARGLEPILGTIIPREDRFEQSAALSTEYIPALAAEQNVRLADPFWQFLQYFPGDYFNSLYSDDPKIHPSWPEGEEELARAWLEVFSPQSPPLDSGDYGGTGTSDIAVFRPATGFWAVRGLTRVHFGREGDLPASADFSGDGTTDIAVFRPATGFWAVRGLTRLHFGRAGDIPVAGDYSGDGTAEPAVFRPATGFWAVRGLTRVYFGRAGDIPVPFYGDGPAKQIAVFRPAVGYWAVRGVTRAYFGRRGDCPAPGGYRGLPGETELGIFREASGFWAIQGVTRFHFGKAGDQPASGNYAGLLPADPAVFRSSSAFWAVRGRTRVYFGRPGDFSVSGPSCNPPGP